MANRKFLVLYLVLPAVVVAQEPARTTVDRIVAERAAQTLLLESAMTDIRGSRDPDLIPFEWKMYWFLKSYGERAADLSNSLTSQEDLALKRAAESEESARTADNDFYVSSFVGYCAGVDTANAVAAAIDVLAELAAERQRSRYNALLANMSPTARAAVDGHLSAVAKGVSLLTGDNMKIATAAPELFKQHIRGACDAYIKGPPLPPSRSNSSMQTMQTTEDGPTAEVSVISE
jgi:hypothetical protein